MLELFYFFISFSISQRIIIGYTITGLVMYIYYLHGTVFIYSHIYNIALYLYIMYIYV